MTLQGDTAHDLLRAVERGAGAAEVRAMAGAARAPARAEDVEAALRLAERLERHQRRETELLALSDSARDLTSLRDSGRVLRAIVRRARQLLGSEIGYLSLYDPEQRDFYVRATEGSVSEDFSRIRVPLGVGICGAVARDKRPLFTSDYAADDRFPHAGLIDTGVFAERITAILGVPLLAADEVIGVLFVGDRFERTYTTEQIALLDSLAAHAAVAIENARLHERSELALAREREASERLRARAVEVQSAAEVHEQLATLLAGGGDLPDLAEVLARELRAGVTVVDDRQQALCTAGEAAAGALDDPVREAFRESSRIGHSVQVPAAGCWVASAGGLSDTEGGVAVWRSGNFSQPEIRTLERAAMMVALVLLARERVAVAEHRAMAELVQSLRTRPHEGGAGLRREARRHGVDLDGRLTLLVCDVPAGRGLAAVQAVAALRLPVLAGADDDGLTLVVGGGRSAATDDPRNDSGLVRRLHEAVALAARTPLTGVTAPLTAVGELPAAHARALRGLALLRRLGREGALVDVGELAPYAVLIGGDDGAELADFVSRFVRPLVEHDARRRTALAETLLAYLDNGRATAATAAQLHLHPNTLRQRLEKATALVPEWDEPATRLDVHLALRFWALGAGPA